MVQRKQLHVLIVGGGIGGLSAAVALRLQGHKVEVFEKSSLHTEIGNAVYCAPNGTAALDHLGIHPETIGGVKHRGFDFLDKSCRSVNKRLYGEEEMASWPAEWWLLARVDLHAALKQRALDLNSPGIPVRIHTDSLISKADCATGTIHLANGGGSVVGDVIVGADGTFSKIRASVLGHEVPVVSTGKCCYRLLIPTADLLADPNTAAFADTPELAIQIAGEDRWIFLYQCSGGRSANLAAFVPKDEVGEIKKGLTGYDQSGNKKQLMSHFEDFAPAVLRMLDKASEDCVKLWDLVDMELQPSLIKHKAVLIGDAAHPFLPYMGQGAAQAIEDACALGVVLPLGTPPEDVPQRLELWQRLRKDRAYKIVENTRHRSRRADGSDGPPQTFKEFSAAMAFAIHHDAWKHAEEAFKKHCFLGPAAKPGGLLGEATTPR